jgi:hypothetical protein
MPVPASGARKEETTRPATLSLLPAAGRRCPRVCAEANIVEAFPNAFLGVVLPEEDFVPPATIRPRGKFDWLYDRWRSRGLFRTIVAAARLPEEIAVRCEDETDHDLRAALVCLLTATFVFIDDYKAVGTETDGYFFLPPTACGRRGHGRG